MSTIKSTQSAVRPKSEVAAQVLAQSEALRREQRRQFMWKSLLAHLVVIGFLIFALFPIYFLILAAFRAGQGLYSTNLQLIPTNLSMDNFDHMINHTPMLTWLKNSLIVAGATTVLSVCLATTAAYAFSRFAFPGRSGIVEPDARPPGLPGPSGPDRDLRYLQRAPHARYAMGIGAGLLRRSADLRDLEHERLFRYSPRPSSRKLREWTARALPKLSCK